MLARTVVLDWNEFCRGNIVPKNQNEKAGLLIKSAAGIHVMLAPHKALAAAATASDGGWNHVFLKALEIVDWVVIGVIIFAGLSWMFANRTKAIELLLGGSIGYVIVRHATDIRDFLKSL